MSCLSSETPSILSRWQRNGGPALIGHSVRDSICYSDCVDGDFELSSQFHQIPQFDFVGATREFSEAVGNATHHSSGYVRALLICLHCSQRPWTSQALIKFREDSSQNVLVVGH